MITVDAGMHLLCTYTYSSRQLWLIFYDAVWQRTVRRVRGDLPVFGYIPAYMSLMQRWSQVTQLGVIIEASAVEVINCVYQKSHNYKTTPSPALLLAGWLYGIQYQTNSAEYRDGTTAYHAKPTPCADCYVPQRSAQLMNPASNTCPVGWTREYNGYLMSEASHVFGALTSSHHSTSYICVDSAPEVATGPGLTQGLLYFTRVGCGTLPCSKFTARFNVPCVVCTKW